MRQAAAVGRVSPLGYTPAIMRSSDVIGLITTALGIAAVVMCTPGASLASSFDDSDIRHIAYPAWFSDSPFFDLAEELDVARSGGKQGLMVLFTTEGCSYCYMFVQKSLGDPELSALTRRRFQSVGFEIFDDREMTDPAGVAMPIKQFAEQEGAEFAPTLLFYGLDGERLLKVVGYQKPERFRGILDYLGGGHYRTESLSAYFGRRAEAAQTPVANAGSELKEDPLFARPPFVLDRSSAPASKPLLVIFEKTDCADCEDFHGGVLADGEVREALARFEVVRFDAADDKTPVTAPDSSRLTPAAWFAQAELSRAPALLFFNEQGDLVLETDALVLRQRMMNSLNYVLERAYEKGWSYQRFARSKAIERQQARQGQAED
jgi:thioredoxin-related protein